MNALDFEYDGLTLSEFGCVICTFDSSDLDNVTMGSVISFNTTYVRGNKKFVTHSFSYKECLETDFSNCKDPCVNETELNKYFSVEEQRAIMRWLNRGEYLRFRPVDEEYEDLYYEGSFYNIEKIEMGDRVVGFQLFLTTNSPFALHAPKEFRFDIESANGFYTIPDISDDIGYTYADLEITCKQAGELKITNSMDGRITSVKNCKSGEKISMKDMIIETSDTTHQESIMDDFNFEFLRISNTFRNRTNKLTFSIPCSVTLKYTPTMKVGI